jgi:hypothetical protein
MQLKMGTAPALASAQPGRALPTGVPAGWPAHRHAR